MFHINAQLIDAGNGGHLWADKFDVPFDKLSDAQAAIVGHIANTLNVELVAIESRRSLHERPDSPDALDFYLRARSVHNMARSLDQLNEAQKLYDEAIARQPNYVDALAQLGLLLLEKCREHDDPLDAADRAEAESMIARALTIDPANVTALTARGLAQSMNGQFEESEASLKAALADEPNNVTARDYLAHDDWRLGRPQETVDGYAAVLRLDPQGPVAKKRFTSLGMAYFMIGKFGQAIDYLLRGLAGEPTSTSDGLDRIEFSNAFLIAAYEQTGKKDQAAKRYDQYNRQWPHRSVWRLASYFDKAQSKMSGFGALLAGLESAGMPQFEKKPDELPNDASKTTAVGDFDPAPPCPGAGTLVTTELARYLQPPNKAVVLDAGIGAAVLPGAIWVPHFDSRGHGLDREIMGPQNGRMIVVVGDGFYGWSGYEAASRLRELGLGPLKCLVGGEEALAQSGIPTEDRRAP